MFLIERPTANNKEQLATADLVRYMKAHAALDEFWARVCEAQRSFLEDLCISEAQIKIFLEPISVRNSKQHIQEFEEITKRLSTVAVNERVDRSIPERVSEGAPSCVGRVFNKPALEVETCRRDSQIVWGPTDPPSTPMATPKEKIKTRPGLANLPTPSPAVADLLPQTPAALTAEIKVAVSAERLSLFHRMFDPLSASKRTACVAWDDFLAAMMDAGCAIEQKGGSAATFWVAAKKEGTVIVHRPHPDSKLNPIMLRDCWKKLTRYFGWDQDSFVLRPKEHEKEKEGREAWVIGDGRG